MMPAHVGTGERTRQNRRRCFYDIQTDVKVMTEKTGGLSNEIEVGELWAGQKFDDGGEVQCTTKYTGSQ